MDTGMNRREFMRASAATGAVLMVSGLTPARAEELQPIPLLTPQAGEGNAVMQLLWKRQSTRQFSPEPLPVPVLSNLLWAAFGINRPDGKRTAPTANNKQEIDLYVATAQGLYLYEAAARRLTPIPAEDIRALTGIPAQPYVKDAPVNLVYVADYAKMKNYFFGTVREEVKDLYTAAATGCISQNVYLFCVAAGLARVVRAEIDRPALASVMKLRPEQKIIPGQFGRLSEEDLVTERINEGGRQDRLAP